MSEFLDSLMLLHQQLQQGDRTASEEIARLTLDLLFERTRRSYPAVDDQLVMTGVVDAVLEYCAAPEQVVVEDGEHLLNLLTRAAWRNVANSVRGERRRRTREERYGASSAVEDVEHPSPLGILLQEEETAERERRIDELMELLPAEADRELLRLRLGGERRTGAFAKVLGITELPIEEQRRAVKREKDRIDKVIRRAKERKS